MLLRKIAVLLVVALAAGLSPAHADSLLSVVNPQVQVSGEAAKYLKGMAIRNADGTPLDAETTVVPASSGVIHLRLALADPIAKSITLRPLVPGTRFRMEQRYETSLTVMDEGPHMDLLDWKHHVSEWEEMQSKGSVTFVSREVMADQFPLVTHAEIVDAVRVESDKWAQQGADQGKRWINLAETCEGPKAGACNVSVSRVMLRVQVVEAGEWKTIQTIEIAVPMGC